MLKIIKKRSLRANRIRYKLKNVSSYDLLRVSFMKSNKYLYSYISSSDGKVLTSLTTSAKAFSNLQNRRNAAAAVKIGELMASIITAKFPLKRCCFDRGFLKYQGKVKIYADTLRNNGVNI